MSMSNNPRLHVDFDETFEDGSVDLRPAKEDLAKITLTEGLKVVLTDEDEIEVDGSVRFDAKYNMWVAIPDWSTLRKPPGAPA